jgi:hypothetical protein
MRKNFETLDKVHTINDWEAEPDDEFLVLEESLLVGNTSHFPAETTLLYLVTLCFLTQRLHSWNAVTSREAAPR